MPAQRTIGNRPQREQYPYGVFAPGDQVHINHWSDITPGTVIAVNRGGTEVVVQEDQYQLADDSPDPDMQPGGFAGHTSNMDKLRYRITRDEQGSITAYTLRKWRGRYCWTAKGGSPDGYQRIGQCWMAKYDYNF